MVDETRDVVGFIPERSLPPPENKVKVNFDSAVHDIEVKANSSQPKSELRQNVLPDSSIIERALSTGDSVSRGRYLVQELLPKISFWDSLASNIDLGSREDNRGGSLGVFQHVGIPPEEVRDHYENISPYWRELIKGLDEETIEDAASFLTTAQSAVDFLAMVINTRVGYGQVVFYENGSVGEAGDLVLKAEEGDFPITATYQKEGQVLTVKTVVSGELAV